MLCGSQAILNCCSDVCNLAKHHRSSVLYVSFYVFCFDFLFSMFFFLFSMLFLILQVFLFSYFSYFLVFYDPIGRKFDISAIFQATDHSDLSKYTCKSNNS